MPDMWRAGSDDVDGHRATPLHVASRRIVDASTSSVRGVRSGSRSEEWVGGRGGGLIGQSRRYI